MKQTIEKIICDICKGEMESETKAHINMQHAIKEISVSVYPSGTITPYKDLCVRCNTAIMNKIFDLMMRK